MSDFDKYFLMKPSDVIKYAKQNLDIFDGSEELECQEIGDGNLNYVFRVYGGGKSVIIKQAGHTARISEDFVLSTDRNRIESEILILEGKYAPGLVPAVYKYDTVMSCCAMEDLSDYTIMRKALLKYESFPLFAEHITTFIVNTLLATSDIVMEHKEKKELVKSFINPQLCEITEDLVYTEPFNDYKGRNLVFKPNEEWITNEIYNDTLLKTEAAKLKFDFMNNAQALIHGDLHTGSIFIKQDATKIIDPEFAFYGPMGYDVGNIIANLIFALANTYAQMEDGDKKENQIKWLYDTIETIINLFRDKFLLYWHTNATEVLAKDITFANWYLDNVIIDSAGVTGLELCRRIIGMAQVIDITTIKDEQKRIAAERACLTCAKKFIKNRKEYKNGKDFVDTIKKCFGKE